MNDKILAFLKKLTAVLNVNDPLCMDAFKNYHSKFPLALAIPGEARAMTIQPVLL